MSVLTRPILQINLSNILDNYIKLTNIVKNSTLSVVVKDDAYSLGADKVASLLYEKGHCRHFFVAHAIEGERIIDLVPEAKIYVLQGVGADSIDVFKKIKNLIPVICSVEMLNFWKQNKIENIKPAIQIETGLNRLGFRQKDLQSLSEDDKKMFGLVISHLACADEKDHFMNQRQIKKFNELKKTYFPNIPASISASGGVFLGEEFHQDMVRQGASIYGINATSYQKNMMKNVVTVKAPILQITDLPKDEYVGYSATYKADVNKKIAIISIGYGDGIPRSLSNVGKVYFYKQNTIKEAKIIGRVSMDNIICDITNIEDLHQGDFAYICDGSYTLDDMAADIGTISYELMSRIGKNTRFIREYL